VVTTSRFGEDPAEGVMMSFGSDVNLGLRRTQPPSRNSTPRLM
jgi:hypothetical protein